MAAPRPQTSPPKNTSVSSEQTPTPDPKSKIFLPFAPVIGYNVTLTLAKPIVPMSPILPPVRESKVMKPITESVRG
jgi:hypothetical protein